MKRLGQRLTHLTLSHSTGLVVALVCLVAWTGNPSLLRVDQALATVTADAPLPTSPTQEEEESSEVVLIGHRHRARHSCPHLDREARHDLPPRTDRDDSPLFVRSQLRSSGRLANYPLRC